MTEIAASWVQLTPEQFTDAVNDGRIAMARDWDEYIIVGIDYINHRVRLVAKAMKGEA